MNLSGALEGEEEEAVREGGPLSPEAGLTRVVKIDVYYTIRPFKRTTRPVRLKEQKSNLFGALEGQEEEAVREGGPLSIRSSFKRTDRVVNID